MEYLILNNNVMINNVEFSNFINIIEIDEEAMKANINISNTEIYLSIPLSMVDTEISIREYFSRNIEVT